jgi:hypothetical protein
VTGRDPGGRQLRALRGLSTRDLRSAVASRVRVDTRSLAVFRVVVGLLAAVDVALRARNLRLFYSDDGVVPRWLARELAGEFSLSVYFLAGDPGLVAALFVLQALAALALAVGYRTRVAAAVTFLLVVSLDHRNLLVTSYADVLFRLLLFWALFLPLGERWSVDAVRSAAPARESVTSLASAAVLLQVVYMYVGNATHKWGVPLWQSGEAAVLVLALEDVSILLADALLSVPWLVQLGGVAWYYMVAGAWLLVVLAGRWRTTLVGLFVVAHLSFAATVRIGAYPWVAIAGLVLFLQASFWTDLEHLLGAVDRRGTALAGRLHALERRGRALANRHLALERRLVGVGRSALTRVGLAGRVEARAASARRHVATATGILARGLLLWAVVFVLVGPAGSAAAGAAGVDERVVPVSSGTAPLATVGVVQPPWTVFAPDPRTSARYHVFAAETATGETRDVYNGRPLSYDRPDGPLQGQYDTYRERFYMNGVRVAWYDDVPRLLAEHHCERYREHHGVRLVRVNMYVVEEQVTRQTLDDPAGRERHIALFYRHGCGTADPGRVDPPPSYHNETGNRTTASGGR